LVIVEWGARAEIVYQFKIIFRLKGKESGDGTVGQFFLFHYLAPLHCISQEGEYVEVQGRQVPNIQQQENR